MIDYSLYFNYSDPFILGISLRIYVHYLPDTLVILPEHSLQMYRH